jgi:TldD protein
LCLDGDEPALQDATHAAADTSVAGVFDYAVAGVEGALAAGARYADARVMDVRSESMTAQNGEIEGLRQVQRAGVGVRALFGSSWGFFATSDLTDATARRAGEMAAETARASARVPGPDLELAPIAVTTARWESEFLEDPLSVSLAEKGDLLVAVTLAGIGAGARVSQAGYQIWDTEKWFVSSEGHRISQRIRECGADMSATAVGDGETQRRSSPGVRGQYGTCGWELVRGLDLLGNAVRVGEEAVALLSAPLCPEATTDLVLGSDQVALQIHESVGHATELDRILGWEAAFAGTSWLDMAQLGSLRFGSELMNVTADATIPGALGSFGYDDEGTPARNVDIVRDGAWVGVLSGRDSAALAGVAAGGMVRADGHDRLPMVRMTNIGLLPGSSSLEEMIAETGEGVYMDTNRSWSIDDRRLNFQFGCEIAWEIKDGRLGRMLRNPTYTGISPHFWGSLDMVGGASELTNWGISNCGKGQPLQVGHTGHPAVPCRFRGVRVGVRG